MAEPTYSYDRTKYAIGDRVRDNQTLKEGVVRDVTPLLEWGIVITVFFARDGIIKNYEIARNAVKPILDNISIRIGEVVAGQIKTAGETISTGPSIAAAATKQTSRQTAPVFGKSQWDRIRRRVNTLFTSNNIGTLDRDDVLAAIEFLEKEKDIKLSTFAMNSGSEIQIAKMVADLQECRYIKTSNKRELVRIIMDLAATDSGVLNPTKTADDVYRQIYYLDKRIKIQHEFVSQAIHTDAIMSQFRETFNPDAAFKGRLTDEAMDMLINVSKGYEGTGSGEYTYLLKQLRGIIGDDAEAILRVARTGNKEEILKVTARVAKKVSRTGGAWRQGQSAVNKEFEELNRLTDLKDKIINENLGSFELQDANNAYPDLESINSPFTSNEIGNYGTGLAPRSREADIFVRRSAQYQRETAEYLRIQSIFAEMRSETLVGNTKDLFEKTKYGNSAAAQKRLNFLETRTKRLEAISGRYPTVNRVEKKVFSGVYDIADQDVVNAMGSRFNQSMDDIIYDLKRRTASKTLSKLSTNRETFSTRQAVRALEEDKTYYTTIDRVRYKLTGILPGLDDDIAMGTPIDVIGNLAHRENQVAVRIRGDLKPEELLDLAKIVMKGELEPLALLANETISENALGRTALPQAEAVTLTSRRIKNLGNLSIRDIFKTGLGFNLNDPKSEAQFEAYGYSKISELLGLAHETTATEDQLATIYALADQALTDPTKLVGIDTPEDLVKGAVQDAFERYQRGEDPFSVATENLDIQNNIDYGYGKVISQGGEASKIGELQGEEELDSFFGIEDIIPAENNTFEQAAQSILPEEVDLTERLQAIGKIRTIDNATYAIVDMNDLQAAVQEGNLSPFVQELIPGTVNWQTGESGIEVVMGDLSTAKTFNSDRSLQTLYKSLDSDLAELRELEEEVERVRGFLNREILSGRSSLTTREIKKYKREFMNLVTRRTNLKIKIFRNRTQITNASKKQLQRLEQEQIGTTKKYLLTREGRLVDAGGKYYALDAEERELSKYAVRNLKELPEEVIENLPNITALDRATIYELPGGLKFMHPTGAVDAKTHLSNIKKALTGGAVTFLDIETDADSIINIAAQTIEDGSVTKTLDVGKVLRASERSIQHGPEEYTPSNLLEHTGGYTKDFGEALTSEKTRITALAHMFRNTPGPIAVHNMGFDLPYIIQRATELDLPPEVIEALKSKLNKQVDTMFIAKIAQQFMDEQISGGLSLQTLAKALDVRGKDWIEEHIGLKDVETTTAVFNKLKGIIGNNTIGELSQSEFNTTGQYYFGVTGRETRGRAWQVTGFERLDDSGVRATLQEVHYGESIATGKTVQVTDTAYNIMNRLETQFEVFTDKGALDKTYDATITDLAMRRSRRLMSDVTLLESEKARAALVDTGMQSFIDAAQAGELTQQEIKRYGQLVTDPRLQEQVFRVGATTLSEIENVHKPVYEALAKSQQLTTEEKNTLLRKYWEEVEQVFPWERNADIRGNYNNRIAINIPALGNNPASINISSASRFQSDLENITERMIPTMEADKLATRARAAGIAEENIERLLQQKSIAGISDEDLTSLSEEMWQNELSTSWRTSRTEYAKKIDPIAGDQYANMSADEIRSRAIQMGKSARDTVNAEEHAMFTYGEFNNYMVDRSERMNAQAQSLLEPIQSKYINAETQIAAIGEARGYNYGLLPVYNKSIPDFLKGKTVADIIPGYQAELGEKKGLTKGLGLLKYILGNTDEFSPELVSNIHQHLGWEDADPKNARVLARSQKTLGELSETELSSIIHSDTAPEKLKRLALRVLGGTEQEGLNVALPRITRPFASKFSIGASIVDGAEQIFSQAGETLSRHAIPLAVVAAGAAFFALRKPNLNQVEEKDMPLSTTNRDIVSKQTSLYNSISIKVEGEAHEDITQQSIVESIQRALHANVASPMPANPNIQMQDNRKKFDKQHLDEEAGKLLK